MNQSILVNTCIKFCLCFIAVAEVVYVFLLAVLYYPMFACVDSKIPLVGFFLGAVYSLIW